MKLTSWNKQALRMKMMTDSLVTQCEKSTHHHALSSSNVDIASLPRSTALNTTNFNPAKVLKQSNVVSSRHSFGSQILKCSNLFIMHLVTQTTNLYNLSSLICGSDNKSIVRPPATIWLASVIKQSQKGTRDTTLLESVLDR